MVKLTINNTMILLLTIGVLIFIIIVVFMVLRDRKKDQKEIDELLTDLRKDRKEKEVIEELEKEMKKEENNSVAEPELEVEKLETKKIEELVKEETTKEVEQKKTEIEEMLGKMQEDLKKQPEEIVHDFENEQEEKAIISYQELIESIQTKSSKVEVIDDELEYQENASNPKQITETVETIGTPQSETSPVIDDAIKKFKSTEFISPVYGKMEEHLEYPTVPSFSTEEPKDEKISVENKKLNPYLDDLDFRQNMEIHTLEQTLNMPPISSEIKKNDEFLRALKEFRKNLD